MKEKKKPAIKRVRKVRKIDNQLPMVIGLNVASLILIVVIGCGFFVIKKSSEDTGDKGEVVSEEMPRQIDTEPKPIEINPNDTEEEKTDENEISETEVKEIKPVYNKKIEEYMQKMSLEQKLDQLFILDPVAMVNSNQNQEEEEISIVNLVGDKTKNAFQDMQLGGLIISTDNLNGDDIQNFLIDLYELAQNTYNMQVFFASLESEYDWFKDSDDYKDIYDADIVVNDSLNDITSNCQLNIKVFSDGTAFDQMIKALSEDADMILVTDKEFDYKETRKKILSDQLISREMIEEKVRKIISEKLKISLYEMEASVKTEPIMVEPEITENDTATEISETEEEADAVTYD